MRILYAGNNNIEQIAAPVKKRYSSLDIMTATSVGQVKYSVNKGEIIDRVVLFDTILNSSDIANNEQFRVDIQKLIQIVRNGNVSEIVCIAQSKVTGQYFLEELFDIQYSSSVHVVGKTVTVADIIAFSVQSISELKKTGEKNIVDEDIYQSDDDVIWSDSKAVTTDWEELNENSNLGQTGQGNYLRDNSYNSSYSADLNPGIDYPPYATGDIPMRSLYMSNGTDKFRLNIALELLVFYLKTASWEYKTDVNNPIAFSNNKNQTEKPKKEKRGLFGKKKKNA